MNMYHMCHKTKKFPRNVVGISKYLIKNKRQCMPKGKSIICHATIWQDIITEDQEFENFKRKERLKNMPDFECPSNYLKRELFPYLIPAFEKLCYVAMKRCAFCMHLRFFDFLDGLAEILYNVNPLHPERKEKWTPIHCVYKDSKRPYYPYFWFLNEEEAAVLIQSMSRRFMTRAKYNLEVMKEERKKIQEGVEKQQRCFTTLKEDVVRIYR